METPINTKVADKLFAILSQDKRGNEGILTFAFGPAVFMEKKFADKIFTQLQSKENKKAFKKSKMTAVFAEFERKRA